MSEKRVKRNVSKTKVMKKSIVKKDKEVNKSKKRNIKPITIIDYAFFVSLVLSIILGMQTNTAIFFWPFTIVLIITIICMCIILINAIYSKIKK